MLSLRSVSTETDFLLKAIIHYEKADIKVYYCQILLVFS